MIDEDMRTRIRNSQGLGDPNDPRHYEPQADIQARALLNQQTLYERLMAESNAQIDDLLRECDRLRALTVKLGYMIAILLITGTVTWLANLR